MLIGFAIMLWFCGASFEINDYSLKENLSFPVSVAGVVILVIGIFQTKKIKLKAFGCGCTGVVLYFFELGIDDEYATYGMTV